MKTRFDAVIFDLDGTIWDTYRACDIACLNECLRALSSKYSLFIVSNCLKGNMNLTKHVVPNANGGWDVKSGSQRNSHPNT